MAWRERALAHAVKLHDRIRALDGRMYYGCGFHYDMHRRIENLTEAIREGTPDFRIQLVHEVCLERLTRDVIKAERSADSYEQEIVGRD